MKSPHKFHIPVMGIGFTVDTPLKVARYGIDSVIFIADDILLEKMRKMYCTKNNLLYTEIVDSENDARAKRIIAYLDLVHDLVQEQAEMLYDPKNNIERNKYFELLPDESELKIDYVKFISSQPNELELENWLKTNIVIGSIDVNIMTKLDKENYSNKVKLDSEYNDAHAALRGFANSKLKSSVVFSAGMNPRLFSYAENLVNLLPYGKESLNKKIILKVSDYRSALIQGKFLAKKGLWVSEYRVESGLNCGGHAFATEGYLMGPILEEFKNNRETLYSETRGALDSYVASNGKSIDTVLDIRITAQGGVGTYEEQRFLLEHYQLDSIGWGTPFLLVPEATNVDELTIQKLIKAKEKDLYLSSISPLGVPFNNLKGSSKEIQRLKFIEKGRPGSACPKKFLSLNKEFTEEAICTASRQYQSLKLESLKDQLSLQEYKKQSEDIMQSTCLCVGLGTTALIVNEIERKTEGNEVLICPGPNMAYFSKKVSLKQMIGHIYGRESIIERTDRPHMFVKELGLYVNYLKNKLENIVGEVSQKERVNQRKFVENLKSGIAYYNDLFSSEHNYFSQMNENITEALDQFWMEMILIEEMLAAPELATAEVH